MDNYEPKIVEKLNIRENAPEILACLLQNRTYQPSKSKNIIWANDHYKHLGSFYAPMAQMKPEWITGKNERIILSRAHKDKNIQKERTKSKAEVFTPTWIVKKQNDAVDKNYQNDDLTTYLNRTWLEITCGEAPYMATRYDMETGEAIPLNERVGFVDRKLKRLNAEISDKGQWQHFARTCYQSSYGFEWNGDSLFLARENLLYTYRDYFVEKWQAEPTKELLLEIAEIISWNVFQMDGLTYTIPLTQTLEKVSVGFDIFGEELFEEQGKQGEPARIMDWKTGNKIQFAKLIGGKRCVPLIKHR